MPNRSTLYRRKLKEENPEAYAAYLERKNALRRKAWADDGGYRDRQREFRKLNPKVLSPEERERRNAWKRADRAANPEKYRAARRASYHANKEKEREQHRRWAQKPEVAEYRKERMRSRLADPEVRDRKHAKDIITRSLGVSAKLVPREIVEIKVEDMRLRRLLKAKGVRLQANY